MYSQFASISSPIRLSFSHLPSFHIKEPHMTLKHALAPLFLLCTLALPAAAADPTVTLTGVHLCCDNCVRGVATALTPVKGATATCDKSASTVVVTASSKETL